MPGGGSKPGERRGGRKRGTPNKRTEEKKLLPLMEQARAHGAGHKLAKEVIEEFMIVAAGTAARYQPRPRQEDGQEEGKFKETNKLANPDLFEKWAKLAVAWATDLAPYQSPTFRAIVVAPPPPDPGTGRVKRFTLTIFDDGGRELSENLVALPDNSVRR